MSRQIDITQPLSSEEVEYLEARDHQGLLDQNALNLMGGGADEAIVEAAITGQSTEPQEPVSTDAEGDPDDTGDSTEVVEETVTEVTVEETTEEVPAE